jgi:acetylornithine deacetylase/succinyl-diaminopimelate desuccinylase-like protein
VVQSLLLEPFLQRERESVLDALDEWLRIPSISSDRAHASDVRDSAQWCADRMKGVGLEHVEVLQTDGHPSVYGDWLHAGDAPTVVVYGHHDVQPVEPVDEWVTPPFEPSVRDGQLFARGAVDDKGQVLYHLEALRGLFTLGDGRLPVNLKLVVEGEEEVGSPNFESLLQHEQDRLACDVVVVSDTGMLAADVPSMCTGMRGLVLLEVELRTATSDLHSGSYGGAVPNAAHVAARLIAALHDEEQRVTIPGFYDRVRALTPEERHVFARVPWDDAMFMREAGVSTLVGERGATTLERIWARPTAEIVGMESGWSPGGIRTIVPAVARIRLSCRLVADQRPDEMFALCERWVREQVPDGVDVRCTRHGGVAPARTPLDHPAVTAAAAAIERVWGRAPLYTREGGSGPEEALGRVLDAPVVFLGVGLPDDGIHGPNERIVLDQLWRGVLAAGELWDELSRTTLEGKR